MTALACPACRAPLRGIDPAASKCTRCGGLWLTPAALSSRNARLAADLVAVASSEPRSCPRCSTGMTVYRSPRVEIDACDACAGVFLDAGELETLTRAAPRTVQINASPASELKGHVPVGPPVRSSKVAPGEYVPALGPSLKRADDSCSADVVVGILGFVASLIFDLLTD